MRFSSIILFLVATFIFPYNANAYLISVSSANFSFNGLESASDFIGINQFDGTLGTLESVAVTINGGFTLQVSLEAGYSSSGGFVDQEFLGLGTIFFDFESPAKFFVPSITNSTSQPQTYTFLSEFSYGFVFDETHPPSGGIGGVFPSFSSVGLGLQPPSLITGSLDSFVYDTNISFPQEIDLIMSAHVPGALLNSLHGAGSIFLEYHYQPFSNDSDPVPEPSTFLLLGSGLAGLAWYGRKRKKA